MKKSGWLKLFKKTDPEPPYKPPISFGNLSNGEFFREPTPRDRAIEKEILRRCDDNARRAGVDRRDFIASAMGMCTTLSVINMASGCSSTASGNGGNDGGGGGGNDGGGGYDIPDAAMFDCDVATQTLTGNEFIMDLQTHHIEDEERWRESHPGGNYSGTALASFLTFYDCMPKTAECIGPDYYLQAIFMDSDTTVAVLSGFPSLMCDDGTLCTNPSGNDDMVRSRDRINTAAGGTQRMVQHCQVCPNDQWDKQAAMMEYIRNTHGNHGWKVYPPWGPGSGNTGFWLDDPVVADPFIEKTKELGNPLICAHKGFPLPSFDPVYADPKDVGPAAIKHPDVNFVIYHSAFDLAMGAEGPYDPSGGGVNRLVKTVDENGLKGKNVYAEMGSAWRLVMGDPMAAQHYIGKLLKYLGEDNIVWGSECVWFGSPRDQIEAFRTLTISPQLQQDEGYPELTCEIKAKIFGLNAARIYGIDPFETRNAIDASQLSQLRRDIEGEFGDTRWAFSQMNGPRTRREFLNLQRWRKFTKQPA